LFNRIKTEKMKSKATAYLLWFFLGSFSLHRFYVHKWGSGIIYLLTLQLFGIGWLIDLFLTGSMVDNYNTRLRLKQVERNELARSAAQTAQNPKG